MTLRDTTTKRLSFNDHMDRWYAAHPEIVRVDWPDSYPPEGTNFWAPALKVRVVETGRKEK